MMDLIFNFGQKFYMSSDNPVTAYEIAYKIREEFDGNIEHAQKAVDLIISQKPMSHRIMRKFWAEVKGILKYGLQ